MKNKLKLIVSIVITVAILGIVFRGVDFHALGQACLNLRWGWFLLALGLNVFSMVIKAWRWHYLLLPVRRVGSWRLFQYYYAGFFGNFLPARAGEFLRAYVVAEREKVPWSAALATIVMERLFDMFFVLMLFPLLFIVRADVFSNTQPITVGELSFTVQGVLLKFGYISLLLSLGLLLFSLCLHFKPEPTLKLTTWCLGPLPAVVRTKVDGFVRMFMQGLGVLGSFRGTLMTFLLSAFNWTIGVLVYAPLFSACNIVLPTDPFSAALLTVVFVATFITIVPSPGFLGSFQLACVVALHNILGIEYNLAVAYGLIAWAAGFLPVLVLGPIYLMKFGLSLGSLDKSAAAH